MREAERHGRRFQTLWLATGISSVGDGMVLVAFPLLALTLTRNPLAIAGVVVAARLAAALVALPVGALVDRTDRRRMVIAVEVSRGLTMAGFAAVVVTSHDSLTAIYIAAFLSGGLTVALDVIATACIPEVVPTADLVAANARMLTAELSGEELIGQAIGGVAFSVASAIPFACDAASFAVSASLMSYAVPGGRQPGSDESLVSGLLAGLRHLVGDRALRILAAVLSGLAFCQAMVFGVLSIYATRSLGLSAAGYGLFLAVAGSGNVMGAACGGGGEGGCGAGRCIIGAGATAVAGYALMAAANSPALSVVGLTAETAAVVVGNVAVRSLRQVAAGQDMQGRVASAFQMLVLGALPLGALAGGVLAGAAGTRTVLAVAAAVQAVFLVAMAARVIGGQAAPSRLTVLTETPVPAGETVG